MRVGKRQVDGSWPVSSCEWEPSVDARGIKEGVASICGSVEVWGGLFCLSRGEEAKGVRCRVVDLEVAGD